MNIPHFRSAFRAWRTHAVATVVLAAAAIVPLSLSTAGSAAAQDSQHGAAKPTIVLIHGAWADASSWTKVITRLQNDGYTVVAPANPLRSVAGDAAFVRAFLQTLSGPVVLVGHSYGGFVITNAATGLPNIKALVYVNAFAPDQGETAFALAGADSALAADPTTVFDFVPATLPPTGSTELYLKKSTVFNSFAPELSRQEKTIVWATQRSGPISALNEPSGAPAWRTIPSWYLIGTNDKIIPAGSQRAMAQRAGSVVTEYDAGHLGLITDPKTVTRGIERAAVATAHAG